ncbi:MAG: hypothetical protein ACK4RK_01610 [Gemmataceae bacterium]
MNDYQIQTNTRRCAATGRELGIGEKVYSVLLQEEGKLIRKDYGSDAWHGPPPHALGFWITKVRDTDSKSRPTIDDELLLDCFRRLEGQNDAERVQFRYIVALLLMRRKRLKFEEIQTEGDQEFLCLRCPRARTVYRVLNPRLTEEQMTEVQDEVFRVLGWE